MGLLLGLCGCTPKGKSLPTVSVTMEPQRYFAERIAGDRYQIHCVVPAGQSPESYDPTPRQMIELSESVAYLQIGYIGFSVGRHIVTCQNVTGVFKRSGTHAFLERR